MAKAKNLLKSITPPIIIAAIRSFKVQNKDQEIWSGNYSSWSEAQVSCTGYDSRVILEKCKFALLKVKNGKAVYERDSVLFDEIQHSWGLLVGLQNAALENNGELCVLDFGGSLGSTYYQNRGILSSLKKFQWCIVEQPHFVACGKENFEDEHLKFYSDVEECLLNHKPNVLIISGVLQYMEHPYEWLEKLLSLGVKNIIFDRTSFVNNKKDILTVQNVPESIYNASYPAWFFNKERFLEKIRKHYKQMLEFDSKCDYPIEINGLRAYWTGFLFKKYYE